MKHEWRKHERELYSGSNKPVVITIPEMKFIMISGTGNPNSEGFGARVSVLMSLAYAIKTRHKATFSSDPGFAAQFAFGDYAVYPLEGVWTAAAAPVVGVPLDKETLVYTIMVRQPDFVTSDMFDAAFADVKKRKPHPLLDDAGFGAMEDGACVQMLHVGSFDDEPATFDQMYAYAEEAGYERVDHYHREIYLNDARKTMPDKLRTILRYRVRKAGEHI